MDTRAKQEKQDSCDQHNVPQALCLASVLHDRGQLSVDGNLDSLDLVTLYFDLEDRFGVAIEETDISESELHRIGNLVDYITSRTPINSCLFMLTDHEINQFGIALLQE